MQLSEYLEKYRALRAQEEQIREAQKQLAKEFSLEHTAKAKEALRGTKWILNVISLSVEANLVTSADFDELFPSEVFFIKISPNLKLHCGGVIGIDDANSMKEFKELVKELDLEVDAKEANEFLMSEIEYLKGLVF